MRRQVEQAVARFLEKYMSAREKEVIADVHDSHVLVTIRRVVCPAEREYALEENARARFERLFSEAFDAVKAELELAVAGITERGIRRSRITVDPATGDAIMMFALEGSPPHAVSGGPERSHKDEENTMISALLGKLESLLDGESLKSWLPSAMRTSLPS